MIPGNCVEFWAWNRFLNWNVQYKSADVCTTIFFCYFWYLCRYVLFAFFGGPQKWKFWKGSCDGLFFLRSSRSIFRKSYLSLKLIFFSILYGIIQYHFIRNKRIVIHKMQSLNKLSHIFVILKILRFHNLVVMSDRY